MGVGCQTERRWSRGRGEGEGSKSEIISNYIRWCIPFDYYMYYGEEWKLVWGKKRVLMRTQRMAAPHIGD